MVSPMDPAAGSYQMVTGVLSIRDNEEEEPIPPLKIEDFKVPDFHLPTEKKKVISKLRQKFNSVTEEFLQLFEKRCIIFVQDGADLQKDLNLFGSQVAYAEQFSAEGVNKELSEVPKVEIRQKISGAPPTLKSISNHNAAMTSN